MQVFCVGTADTKLEELRYLAESVQSNLTSFSTKSSPKVESFVDLICGFYHCRSVPVFLGYI